MIRIPKKNRDLRRRVIRRDLLRAGGYLLWLAAWLAGIYSYNNSHPYIPLTDWRYWLTVVAAAGLGFFLFRVWKLLFDFSCRGVIEQSDLSRTYSASSDPGLLKGLDYDFRLNTSIKIRMKSGLFKKIRFEQKRGFYFYYHEGNQVIHFHGLPYPISTDPKAPNGYVCAACGAWSEELSEHCPVCRYSMIDPKDLSDK